MSPKVKTSSLPATRVSQKLKAETIQCAEISQENLSEYVRKSVEIRNNKILKVKE